MINIRYACLPVSAGTKEQLEAQFEVVTAYGTGEGEDFTQTHWLIEDKDLEYKQLKVRKMRGAVIADVKNVHNIAALIK